MRRNIYLFTLLTFWTYRALSCDVCGCRLGGLSYGILPQHYQHLFGVKYSHAAFNAHMDHDSEYSGEEYSNDTYQRIDLMGRISFADRWQVNVQLPYLINQMDGNVQQVSSSGIGDPVVMVYYTPFNTGTEDNRWKNSLLVGGGVKLPLGDHDKLDDGTIINRNFQMGSGSLDYLLSANYTLSFNNWGMNYEASYKMNTSNSDGYRFGNQFNASAYLFRYLEVGPIGILPFAGAFYENSVQHTDDGIIQVNTGGAATYGTLGSQIYWKQWNLNVEYQIPMHQSYNSDNVATIEAGNRISLTLIYSLSGKKKEQKL